MNTMKRKKLTREEFDAFVDYAEDTNKNRKYRRGCQSDRELTREETEEYVKTILDLAFILTNRDAFEERKSETVTCRYPVMPGMVPATNTDH